MSLIPMPVTFLRRLVVRPPFRWVLKAPAVERIVATVLRAATVRESGRFVTRELGGRRGTYRYRLRGSGLSAVIRHGTPDVATLDEIFYQRQYELPAALAERFPQAPRVVDLGANIGLFGLFVAGDRPGAAVVAVEADPENARILRRARDLNGFTWEVVEAVAATDDGVLPFATGRYSLSRVEEGPGVPQLASVDVFAFLAGADLAKIDIEGSEWGLLGSERFAFHGPDALVLEFHPHLAPGEDPEREALRLLRAAGYETGDVRATAAGHGVVWAWRQPRARS
jgi:FkbM family methyltransferase